MEMLRRSAEDTTYKKTIQSIKTFMDDVTVISESKSQMKKTAETPTRAFQVVINEDKAF